MVDKLPEISTSFRLNRSHLKVNEADFFLNVKNVAQYRVQNGKQIAINSYADADEESINLFLEGSVLGALLHQRAVLPFHGSSFLYNGKGVMICGASGAGKSVVTAAFWQQGAKFISDDITPVSVSKSGIKILPVKTRIKLWDDSLRKLRINSDNLKKIRPGMEKFYFPIEANPGAEYYLNQVVILSRHNLDNIAVDEIKELDKFNALRRQIYRKAYLKGMPQTEKKYFSQLLTMANHVNVIHVTRPELCDVQETMKFVSNQLDK